MGGLGWGDTGSKTVARPNDKMKKIRDFYDQRIIGYKSYGVKNLLDLLKILQMTFF